MINIAPLSHLRDYTLCWSRDPAFARPADLAPQGPAESAEDFAVRVEAHEQAEAAFAVAFARAMETGDLAPILRPGATPTRFTVRIVPGNLWRAFEAICLDQRLGPREFLELAFRLAVVRIEDDGHTYADREPHADPATGKPTRLGPVLVAQYIAQLDATARGIVDELGDAVCAQKGAPLGK